jgi:hypothetical protein
MTPWGFARGIFVYDLRSIYAFVGIAAAVNLLIGVMWLMNEFVTSGDVEELATKKANFKKAGIYLALVILGAVVHPGGRRFPQVLEFCWSFIFTGFLICAIVLFIAALRATGIPGTRKIADGRKIPTRNVTFIAWFALAAGVFIAVEGLALPFILQAASSSDRSVLSRPDTGVSSAMTFLMVIPFEATALYLIVLFVGLRRFKNWGRIMAIMAAVLTFPVSWYALWVLLVSDARLFFTEAQTEPTV